MKPARTVVVCVAALGSGMILVLVCLPRGPVPRPKDWLQLVSGPTLSQRTNAQGLTNASATLTLSNSGPRQLMFDLQNLRWAFGSFQASAMPPSPGHLASGAATNIVLPIPGLLPLETASLVYWEIPWWEERTGMRRFLTRVQRSAPFTLWRTPPLMGGILESPGSNPDEKAYFLLKYGLGQPANESESTLSETNRNSSSAGSRR